MSRPRVMYAGKLWGLVDCYVLDDKRRVLSMRGAVRALTTENIEKNDGHENGTDNGNLAQYVSRLPEKYGLKSSGTTFEIQRVEGGIAKAIEASDFVDILAAYSQAAENGEVTHPGQLRIAANCNALLRAISKVGMVALIDEATGYQVERESNELQGLVAKYLTETPTTWRRLWEDDVVNRLCTLYRVERRGDLFPTFACDVIRRLYELILPAEVYDEMKRRNGVGDSRQAKHHQFFRDSLWRFVNNDIPFVAYIARISRSKEEFWNHMRARYAEAAFQLSLPEAS